MRRRISLPVLTVAAVLGSLLVAAPAQAHGYVSSPPSRQAMCAQGRVANCGPIVYEPQSVEAPKGSRQCSGGSRFTVLDDESRGWPATSVGGTVTFRWTLTVAHSTGSWEYYIGGTRIANFSGGNRPPPSLSVSHTVSLGGRTGRQKVLAIWNIADTAMAFYACVDLQVGGGGTPPPPPPPPGPPPPPPPPPPPGPPPPPPPPSGTTWAPNTFYAVGATVTYAGLRYQCRQQHTSLPGWEPPNTPALWLRV